MHSSIPFSIFCSILRLILCYNNYLITLTDVSCWASC